MSARGLQPPQPLTRGDRFAPDLVATACSLDSADIETAGHAPCVASCGAAFVFAELKTRAALAKARPRTEIFSAHVKADVATGILLYVKEQNGGVDIAARMFAPLYGVPEDPATGSANVALVGPLGEPAPRARSDAEASYRAGRRHGPPSLLEASAEKRNGEVTALVDRRPLRADDARHARAMTYD